MSKIKKPRYQKLLPVKESNVSQVCKYVGKDYKIFDTRFINTKGLYVTDFEDYTVLSDVDFTDNVKYAPKSLKSELTSRWQYVMHVSHGMTPSITRNILEARNTGGQILAYKYMECSIEGNECVYYGFIPTIDVKIENSHNTCRFNMMAIYPRKLYIYLNKICACLCSEKCIKWNITLNDSTTKLLVCGKKIPWSKIYIMMGSGDESCEEMFKEPRDCLVCAQCYDCNKSPRYCRRHKICKHKQTRIFDGISFNKSTIKTCRRAKKF